MDSEFIESPFSTGLIPFNEALAFVARCAYPATRPYAAKKRVRESMRSDGQVEVKYDQNGFEVVDAACFFSWAKSKKKLRSGLSKVKNLPLQEIIGHMSGTLPALTCEAYFVVTPTSYKELEEDYIRCKSRVFQLEKTITELRETISSLETELLLKLEAETRQSKQCSENGKKGAGISKRRSY